MKKILAGIVLTLSMSITCVFPGFAGENHLLRVNDDKQVILNNTDLEYSIVHQPKGRYISTGSLTISNPGGGEIGVLMITMAHQDVDETSFHIFLDRWIESEERWANVTSYDFVYNKDNCPGEDLSNKSVSFNIVGQPDKCYYRLRGVHIVKVGDVQEMLNTETDGVLITK